MVERERRKYGLVGSTDNAVKRARRSKNRNSYFCGLNSAHYMHAWESTLQGDYSCSCAWGFMLTAMFDEIRVRIWEGHDE